MSVKITDVAKHAGVSMKTVSRVLNNEPNVKLETRERVLASAKTLKYKPSLAARGLAGSRSYLLALLYDNPSADYIANIQHGASAQCRTRGYHLMVEPVDMRGNDFSAELEMLLGRLPVDGVILTPPLTDSQPLMAILSEAQIPFVRLGHVKVAGAEPNIAMDDTAACFEMTNFLIKMGHKHIGFIKGDPRHSASLLRYLGFCQALEKRGLEIDLDCVAEGDYSFASAQSCARKILSVSPRPTVIFASNDNMAAAIYSEAGRLGLKIPEDLSVCGFDDTPLASVLWPPLTTIGQPIEEMGSRAAQMLIDRRSDFQSGLVEDLRLPYKIIERDSVRSL